MTTTAVQFRTHTNLRQRLVLATLAGTALHVTQIRSGALTPGLSASEVSLLRLLDAVTDGTRIDISVTGTSLVFRPGLLAGAGSGGAPLTHELPAGGDRAVTYYLEALAQLAPFCRRVLSVRLTGGAVTAATTRDPSVDAFRAGLAPAAELRIVRRSAAVPGGGEVVFVHTGQTRVAPTLHLLAPGRVRRIRGVAYAVGVSAACNARAIAAARGVFNRFIPDVHVSSDVGRAPVVPALAGSGSGSGSARTTKVGVGFGICLVAETGTGCRYVADATAAPAEPAEAVGLRAAWTLLEEITVGGCVARAALPAVLAAMVMGAEGDVGRVVLGRAAVDERLVAALRDVKRLVGTEAALRDGPSDATVLMSVVGRGLGNLSRKLA